MTAPLPLSVVDPIAAPLAGAVLAALLDAYDDPIWGLTAPCVAGLVSGGALIADYCCEDTSADGSPCGGQLTVRVVNVYPVGEGVFPQARITAIPACGTPWGVQLEVAVLRCAPAIDTNSVPPVYPTMAQEMDVAERALADAGLLRHVLTTYATEHDQAIAFGPYTPMGPEGGCVGGSVGVTYLVE